MRIKGRLLFRKGPEPDDALPEIKTMQISLSIIDLDNVPHVSLDCPACGQVICVPVEAMIGFLREYVGNQEYHSSKYKLSLVKCRKVK